MNTNETRRGAIEMSLAMLMSGTIGWLVVSSGQTPFNVVFFRCVFGGATLLAVCAVLGMLRRQFFSWRMLMLVALSGIAIVGNWLLLFAAYSRASISMATTVYNTQPFMLVGLGVLVLRERVTMSTIAWLGVAFVGLVMVVPRRAGRARRARAVSGRHRLRSSALRSCTRSRRSSPSGSRARRRI